MPSPLSEHEIYSTLLDALKVAEGCMRQLGYHRGDERWIKAASFQSAIADKVKDIATTRMTFVPN